MGKVTAMLMLETVPLLLLGCLANASGHDGVEQVGRALLAPVVVPQATEAELYNGIDDILLTGVWLIRHVTHATLAIAVYRVEEHNYLACCTGPIRLSNSSQP
jgi:hypothetical protein